jgi:hypothetical protein
MEELASESSVSPTKAAMSRNVIGGYGGERHMESADLGSAIHNITQHIN